MPLSKRESRQRSSELNALMCAWDPIGVMVDPSWPRDEYECLVGPLLRMLGSGAGQTEIASYLQAQIVEHFGLSEEHYDFRAVAARVESWFDRGWRNLAEPVKIFVPLLNEGIDVWRPVQARPLGANLFRIIGVEADVSDETWLFAVGTIVRCEPKRFDDGKIVPTAVEHAETC